MSRRVAVFGTECTGKTTLARALAAHFAVPWSAEYVREFADRYGGEIHRRDLGTIARGQIVNEDVAARRATPLVICDTELLTHTLWVDLLFPGGCPVWVRREAERRCHDYRLYLLCDTDMPFVPDGQRVFADPRDRQLCRTLWRRALIRRRLPFVALAGSATARLEAAVAAVASATGQGAPRA